MTVLGPLVTLGVFGCGEEDPETVEGTGYSFEVPDGWRVLDDDEVAEAFQPPEDGPPARVDADAAIIDDDETGSNISVAVQEWRPFPAVVNGRTARLVARVYSDPALTELNLPAGAEFTGQPTVRAIVGRGDQGARRRGLRHGRRGPHPVPPAPRSSRGNRLRGAARCGRGRC
jgi:hypothetical protein